MRHIETRWVELSWVGLKYISANYLRVQRSVTLNDLPVGFTAASFNAFYLQAALNLCRYCPPTYTFEAVSRIGSSYCHNGGTLCSLCSWFCENVKKTTSKCTKTRFRRTLLGSLRLSPDTLVGCEGIPPPHSPLLLTPSTSRFRRFLRLASRHLD